MALYTDLQAYYPLNGNANDALGAYGGTTVNVVTFSAGQFGDAADMVGTAGAPYIGNFIHSSMNAVNFGGGFTYSGWINSTAGTPGINPYGVQSIANKDGVNGTREWGLYIVGAVLGVACYTGDGANRISRTAPVPATGSFQHIVVTYDGGLPSSSLKIYVNGAQVDNLDDNLGSYTGMTAPTNYLRLGQYVGSPPMPAGVGEHLRFSGSMDDVALWTRELTAAEVLAIYTAGNAGNPLSSLLGPSDLQGQFSSVVHSVAGADADLQGMFSSVVHSVAAADADIQGMFSSVVHSATVASRADLEGQFASVVHSVAADADLQGMFSSVVHSATIAARADLEGMFSSVVHSVAADSNLAGMFSSVVHSDIPAPPAASGGGFQGDNLQSGSLQGSTIQGDL